MFMSLPPSIKKAYCPFLFPLPFINDPYKFFPRKDGMLFPALVEPNPVEAQGKYSRSPKFLGFQISRE